MSSGCPAAGFPVAAALAWVPLFFVPLHGRRLLYKVPFPLDRHIRGICPRLASDPFVERGFAWSGWWRPCVAGVTLVSSLGRSCRDPATFNKALVKGFVFFAGSGLRWMIRLKYIYNF
jgi:Synergist-CTERM protein sorting domain-containing protein